jgi:hypothetical protein
VALSDDQRALLRLLAHREEGYADIAALKGMSVEEVRAEVKTALAELDAAPEPPRAPRAEAAAAPPSEKAEPTEPPTPAPPKPKAEEPSPPSAEKPPFTRPSLPAVPAERRRLLAMAGGALGLVAVALIGVAVLGGDSSSSDSSSTGIAAESASTESDKVTQAILEPVEGGEASGRALFGRLGQEEVVLQVTAEGLEPAEGDESYTVWLYRSPKLALRVGSVKVDEAGQLGARFPIPAELLAYIAGGAFDQVYVSRTSDAAYKREVAQAKEQETLPRYSGETVLRGEIVGPIAEAGQRQPG